MLTKSEKIFTIIFAFLIMAELLCVSIASLEKIHYLSKPLLLLSLFIFFLNQKNNLDKKSKYLALAALLFSLLGDILLMFVTHTPIFFMAGLMAFLTAHIMYVFVFLKKRNAQKKGFLFTLILLFYGATIFYFLKDGLGELLIPVIIYMLVILLMGISAFLRHARISKTSYNLVFLGAIFFIASDSILALNKFYVPFEIADILIMLTYALAQYFIVLGLNKQQ